MQLTDATHAYDCTQCGTTGGVCMEALWLARRLTAAMTARADSLPQDFEVVSHHNFTGCGRNCAVDLRVTAARIAVASGDAGAWIEVAPRGDLRPALASGG